MGDSDSEIEFNFNNHANDNEGQGTQSNDERGFGDAQRDSDRRSVSPIRPVRLRRNRSTSFSEHRRTPYRYHDDNNDGRGRDWHRSPVITPDTFNGDDDWEQYISHFEDCAELGNWSIKEKVLTLAAKLKGQARVFYTGLPSSDKRSYRLLVARLEQRFGSARQQSRWMSRLQSRVRKQGESIAAFGDDLLLMAQKAYANLDSHAQEMLALQQFNKAVPLEMRCRIMDRDCISISEAVDVVERYEELLNENADRKRAITRTTDNKAYNKAFDDNNQSPDGTQTENINDTFPFNSCQGSKMQFQRTNQRTVGSNSQNQSSSNNSEQLSIARTLQEVLERLNRLERGPERPQGSRQNMQRANKTCFICNSPDHFFKQCPRYKFALTGTGLVGGNIQQGNGNQSLL